MLAANAVVPVVVPIYSTEYRPIKGRTPWYPKNQRKNLVSSESGNQTPAFSLMMIQMFAITLMEAGLI